jgi:hypothetical protein
MIINLETNIVNDNHPIINAIFEDMIILTNDKIVNHGESIIKSRKDLFINAKILNNASVNN